MATKIKKKTIKQTKKTSVSPFNIGLVSTIIGFYFMTIGPWDSVSSLVISPILLFIAYIIIFPLSMFLRKKTEKAQTQENEIDPGKS
jgi:membrane protein YdbS with pleckstrin-like domain